MYNVTEQYSQNIAKSVRTTAISGFIKTKSGEILTINDGSIKTGSLSISSRLNSGGDFKPGGVYSSELSVTLLGAAADGLDGARITLNFLLYRGNSEEYDSVPLGTFYVDGSTIQRRGTAVSLKADDALMNFDYPAEAVSGSLHELAATACVKCDVPLRTTTAEFAALPNADITAEVDTARVQTWRDLLIFIAMLTGTFVRIDRTGGLCFVPLTCERNSGGVIVPVREIAGNIRSSTEFSDDTTRITRLFMRRGGGIISAEKNYSESSEKYVALELSENPLLNGLSDSEAETALGNTLSALSVCLNRAYKSDFNGDPALETGDYVRLRGGAVDTSRGYATGMITSQVWRYHGKHTIQCSLSSSIPPEESVQTFALRAADDTSGTALKMRVQPKSQLEKEIDSLRGKVGSGGVGKAAENDPTSEYFNDYDGNKITTYGAGYHHVEGKGNKCGLGSACHVGGMGNSAQYGTALHVDGWNNTLDSGVASSVGGENNVVKNSTAARVDGNGNTVEALLESHITGKNNNIKNCYDSIVCGSGNGAENIYQSLIAGEDNTIKYGDHVLIQGERNEVNSYVGAVIGDNNTVTPGNAGGCCYVFGKKNVVKCGSVFAFGLGLLVEALNHSRAVLGEYNINRSSVGLRSVPLLIGNGSSAQNRSNCFMIDSDGNVYCNHVYETGTSNIEDYFTGISVPAAKAARAVTAAASAEIPIVLLDHTPTAEDLTGSPCVFLQCENAAVVEGESTGIFRVMDIFAEK